MIPIKGNIIPHIQTPLRRGFRVFLDFIGQRIGAGGMGHEAGLVILDPDQSVDFRDEVQRRDDLYCRV